MADDYQRIDAPGIYANFHIAAYHNDPAPEPSLSASLAKILVHESPLAAKVAHPRLNADFKNKDEKKFDVGSCAHEILFGRGRGLAVLPYDDWRTKAAKDAREKAVEKGLQPVKQADFDLADDMAAAAQQQLSLIPECKDFFSAQAVENSECVALWTEHDDRWRQTIWCRSLLDRVVLGADRVVIYDLKTTSSCASPWTVSQHLFSQDYDMQAAMYQRAILNLIAGSGGRIAMRFIVQEVKPPYLLSVVELDPAGVTLGQKKISTAVDLWKRCLRESVWPGYPAAIVTATMPPYEEAKWLDREVHDKMLDDAGEDAFMYLSRFQPHKVKKIYGAN